MSYLHYIEHKTISFLLRILKPVNIKRKQYTLIYITILKTTYVCRSSTSTDLELSLNACILKIDFSKSEIFLDVTILFSAFCFIMKSMLKSIIEYKNTTKF